MQALERLGQSSAEFVGIPLLSAHVALQRFQTSRQQKDAEIARAAVERALELAPQDPRVLMLAARAARLEGDLDAAERWLDEIRRLEPGHSGADFQLALLHEKRKDALRAKDLLLEIAERHPSTYHLFNGGDLLFRLGDFEGARRLIEQGLARAPEHFDGLSRLAQLELMHGDLERAAELYGRLVERAPEESELFNLGTALMMLGRLAEAERCFARVAKRDPSSPFAALNLADVATLRGDLDEGARYYRRVLELTSEDDEALASLRAQALAHLGSQEEAVDAIQKALRRRPDHPWVAYEAALVYVLIEDRASALWNARRARQAGIDPRWFSLAWFDSIRGQLESE